ncbi:MAG: hypothetical protein ACRDPY_04115 [Streptosporangiaceae bacterium]
MPVFSAPGGWTVEVVDLYLTRPRRSRQDPVGDGPQFRVARYGHIIAYVATIEEVAEFVDMATLRREDEP